MNIEAGLQKLGLSLSESKIYLAALEMGQALPKHLAIKAGVPRHTLYKFLPNLLSTGLLSETIIGKRRYLEAEDIQSIIDQKESDLAEIQKIAPLLHGILTSASSKPKIILHEDIEGIKKLYFDNLREHQPILEFVSLEKINPEIEFHSSNYYIPQRIKRKIPVKILISGKLKSSSINLKTDSSALREVKVIDYNEFPFPLDAYIYGDNVSFAVYRTDSKPIGIIIRSKEIATALRSLFNLAWLQGKSEN